MIRPPVEANSGLAAVLRGVVADFQHVSGADIVSIFLYEESTNAYYAPFAAGQPQESLLDSLTDMHEQLGRYLADEQQGKAPDELGIHQYGSTVWLTVTRQRLVARNAPAEIDSTFIRRYQIQSTIGLPLLAGDRLLGLVYLNYRVRDKAPDDARLREFERRAATAAALVQNRSIIAYRTRHFRSHRGTRECEADEHGRGLLERVGDHESLAAFPWQGSARGRRLAALALVHQRRQRDREALVGGSVGSLGCGGHQATSGVRRVATSASTSRIRLERSTWTTRGSYLSSSASS